MSKAEFLKVLEKASDKELIPLLADFFHDKKFEIPDWEQGVSILQIEQITNNCAKEYLKSKRRLLRALEGTGVARVAQSSLARRKSKASRGGSNPLPSNNKKEGD